MKNLNMMKKLRMNAPIELSYKEAKELIKGAINKYDFDNLNKSTIIDTGFEEVQNRKYWIEKIGKKGSILYKGSEYETKAEIGMFEITMSWDYKHPANFAQNQYNNTAFFKIEL